MVFTDTGIDPIGTAEGAGIRWRTNLRCREVAVGEDAITLLQSYGVHRRSVTIGACLKAVHQCGRAAVTPSQDAAYVAAAIEGAGKDAVADGGGRLQAVAYDAAGIACANIERGRDDATVNYVNAVGKAHQARRVVFFRGDGARDGKVLDGGILDVAEEGRALVGVVLNRGRDGVATPVEGAAEGLVNRFTLHDAALTVNADVGYQIHDFASEVITIADGLGECVPIRRRADGEDIGSFDIEGEAVRAREIALAGKGEHIGACSIDVEGNRRHVVIVQLGRVVSAKGEGNGIWHFNDRRDHLGAFNQAVGRCYAADGAGQIVGTTVGKRHNLVDSFVSGRGIDLIGTAEGAEGVRFAGRPVQIVAIVEAAEILLQSDGVHRIDAVVGAFL